MATIPFTVLNKNCEVSNSRGEKKNLASRVERMVLKAGEYFCHLEIDFGALEIEKFLRSFISDWFVTFFFDKPIKVK